MSGTPTRSASSARLDVARLRPAAAQMTAPARGRSAEPIAAPMAPGCSTPTTGRGGIRVTGEYESKITAKRSAAAKLHLF